MERTNFSDTNPIAPIDVGKFQLSDDEFAVLLIAAQGESMIPIGRWERPIRDLEERGLLRHLDSANYVITDMGRAAVRQREQQEKVDLRAVLHRNYTSRQVQENIQVFVEETAQKLARAVLASVKITGDTPTRAAKRWGDVIVQRAIELAEGA